MFILFLKSFACGIAFILGAGATVVLCARGNREQSKKALEANQRCEARLTESAAHQKRIADVLEWWQKRQTDSEFHGREL